MNFWQSLACLLSVAFFAPIGVVLFVLCWYWANRIQSMKIKFLFDWAHWIFGVNRFDNKAFGLAGVTWGFHFGPCIWLINK